MARSTRDPDTRRGVGWTRVAAALGMLLLTAALWWLVTDDGFRVRPDGVRVEGVRYASPDAVQAVLDRLGQGPNVFRVRQGELAGRLASVPEITSADVTAVLPDRVEVRVHERVPILEWRSGGRAWLVDAEGVLFAPTVLDPDAEDPPRPVGGDLPTVDDRRPAVVRYHEDPAEGGAWTSEGEPAVGDRLNPEDLDAMRQLGALTPAALGSRFDELFLSVDEQLGYVLAPPAAWWAVFGHYTPTARPPTIIGSQVRCLRAVLERQERRTGGVRLTGVDDPCAAALPWKPGDRAPGRAGGARDGRADRSPRPGTPAP